MEPTTGESRVAIVTGASRGIGRAIAERFAAEGLRLVLGFRQNRAAAETVAAACAARGGEAVLVAGDVGEAETAAVLCAAALERFGRVDILVNNAGVARESLLATMPAEQVQAVVATNVLGLVWLSQAVLKPMLVRRAGWIVNLSSSAAARPGRGSAVYAGSKGFVEAFTRGLAAEVGRKGIRVNAVAPGVIETDMTEAVRSQAGDRLRERVGLQRFGKPEEVAAAVHYLVSPAASYLNGVVLPVDGAFGGGL